ncbi:tetratricopeptide repeat protein, partial [Gluconacetobacter tumulisoli]|nr:tetratricopeptide repeat protein [Gluconacetobacter tumulisoli]
MNSNSDLSGRISKAQAFLRSGCVADAAEVITESDYSADGPPLLKLVAGRIAIRQNRFDEAEWQFTKGLLQDKNNLGLRRELANLLNAQRRYDEAIYQWHAIAELSSDAGDFQKLAAVFVKLERFDDAIFFLRKALILSPPTSARLHLLGTAFLRSGNFIEAEDAFNKTLELEPSRVDALREYSRLRLKQGDAENAAELLRTVLSIQPDNPRSYRELANALSTARRNVEALVTLGEGIKKCGESAELLRELARATARTGDRLAAMELFGRVLAVNPDDFQASLEFIRQAMMARKFGPAKDMADKLIALHPENPDVHFEYGRVCMETGAPDRAREAFEKALQDKPELHQAHYRLAQLALRASDVARAVEHIGHAVSLDPERVNYRIDRARMNLALNHFDAAKADAEAALVVEPKNLKATQIVNLVREMSDEIPPVHVAIAFLGEVDDVLELRAVMAKAEEGLHEYWIAAPDRFPASIQGARVITAQHDTVEAQLAQLSEAPWMAIEPAVVASSVLARLAGPTIEATLRPLEKIYGRVIFTDAAGQSELTVMRRDLLLFFIDMAEIEGRPVRSLIDENGTMIRTLVVNPQGIMRRLPAPVLEGRDKVFLVSRHGFELYGGGEQFLRGMARVY